MPTGNIMLHCGAQPMRYDEMVQMPRPVPLSSTHEPVPHFEIVDQLKSSLNKINKYDIVKEEYGVSHKGKRCFGLLSLRNADAQSDYEIVWAFRNANDMAFRAKAGTGSKVFICDNMAMVAEYEIGAKHSQNVRSNFEDRLDKLCDTLVIQGESLHRRYRNYKQFNLSNKQADHFMMESIRRGALPKTKITTVDKEWRDPSHSEFKNRNAWSLFNSFTEVNKGANYADQIDRTQILHKTFDDIIEMETGVVFN
jgi:hypothetical protein|tara:strand:- start:1458 stop:2216 length:759 start_codon:yes stop_codon:yes gene_type:complete